MDFFLLNDRSGDTSSDRIIAEGVQLCPFLRNIGECTNFSFLPSSRLPALPMKSNQELQTSHAGRGPIFEDGPNFELAFKLFHGRNGVVPLSGRTDASRNDAEALICNSEASRAQFHPLAASAAAISLSSLGAMGPFGFDAFMSKKFKMKESAKRNKKEQQHEKKPSSLEHEALSNDWLQTGNCPIAKSFRAVNGVLPLVANMLQPPPGSKIRCPPAVVAARAALARTAAVKALKPQPLPTRILAVGLLGMALNVPLGIWREHTKKFSPAWFTAVHATVPFIAMLRKAIHMPKYAMAYTIGASILGQVIGSRAERKRMELARVRATEPVLKEELVTVTESLPSPVVREEGQMELSVKGVDASSYPCGKEELTLTMKSNSSSAPSPTPLSAF